MVESRIKNMQNLGILYSSLVKKCIEYGDVEAIKFLYTAAAHPDNFSAIHAVNTVGFNIIVAKLKDFNSEYLYYLGMVFLGEISVYIDPNLNLAKECFKLAKLKIPKAEARLAYLELKEAELLYSNIVYENMIILQNWASRDLFSSVILAKIKLFEHLKSDELTTLPPNVLYFLTLPLKAGHPLAIQLFEEIVQIIKQATFFSEYDSIFNLYKKFTVNYEILLDYNI